MTFFQDPRDYQISVLGGLLVYGLLALDFDRRHHPGRGDAGVGDAGSIRVHPPVAAAALRSEERADLRAVALSAAAHEHSRGSCRSRPLSPSPASSCCASNGKHVFNPTNFGIVILLLTTNMIWVSPGQWGNVAFFGFLMACLGGLVVHRALRSDVAIAFALCYAALLFGRSFYLGEPMAIPIRRLQSGGLLLFTFFMISDPRTTPDSRAGRFLFAALVAFGAWYVQFRMFRTNGLLWSLTACSMLTPIIDWLMPGNRYQWNTSGRKDDGAMSVWKRLTRVTTRGHGHARDAGHRGCRLRSWLHAGDGAGLLRILRIEG